MRLPGKSIFNTTDPNKTIRSIRPGDSDFTINNGIMVANRASIEISLDCPRSYQSIIFECVNRGWIKPVAHLKQSEYFWEKLGE